MQLFIESGTLHLSDFREFISFWFRYSVFMLLFRFYSVFYCSINRIIFVCQNAAFYGGWNITPIGFQRIYSIFIPFLRLQHMQNNFHPSKCSFLSRVQHYAYRISENYFRFGSVIPCLFRFYSIFFDCSISQIVFASTNSIMAIFSSCDLSLNMHRRSIALFIN